MVNWFKTFATKKEYMIVGALYKSTAYLGLNCGKPGTFTQVEEDSILLLISKKPFNNDKNMIEYTFFYDNRKILHVNDLKFEKYFVGLFDIVDDNT